jgi:hypothetical protein
MTSAPQHPDRAEKERGLDLSLVQVAAGALAAVSSAVAASYFSVAGTLLGAALGSVIGTVGTAVYRASLARTNEKLREIVPIQTVVLKRAAGDDTTTAVRFAGGTEAPGHPATATGSTEVAPTDLPTADPAGTGAAPAGDPARTAANAPSVRPRWRRLAVAAVVAFVVALGGVGAVEAVAGQSLSSLLTGDKSKDRTVWQVITPQAPRRDTGPAPTTSPTATPSGTASGTATPSETVSPSTGTPSPTVTPTPTGAPSPRVTPTP